MAATDAASASHQLWGGRFRENAGKTSSSLAALNCSLPLDSRLFADDIDASKAYAEALQRAGYLQRHESERICKGLEVVRFAWIERTIEFLAGDEDVHTVNERLLTQIVGEVGQRLHTGRSRNDQVVTDMKLWMRKGIRECLQHTRRLLEAMVRQAERFADVLMPGYTHLQRAQPVRFSHWLMSHAFALRQDAERFQDVRKRSNSLPLGSGALAGNPLGVDREWLAQRLGFASVTENSMHTVGDRDFVVDFVYCCSLTSLHLSRLAEDLILYSSKEFDFVRIADEFSTGSSLMPQKRNPDSLELVRGLAGCISGSLSGLMMTIKGIPSTYNKDLQFDKQYCFEAFDRLLQALQVTEGVVATLDVQRHQMESALSTDMLATDWAYYLVRKGVPFRKAHHYIGQVVAYAESVGVELTEIPLGDLQTICHHFNVDIMKEADYDSNVERYDSIGGTSSSAIRRQVLVLKEFIRTLKKDQ